MPQISRSKYANANGGDVIVIFFFCRVPSVYVMRTRFRFGRDAFYKLSSVDFLKSYLILFAEICIFYCALS